MPILLIVCSAFFLVRERSVIGSARPLLFWGQANLEQLSRWTIVVLCHDQAQDLALRYKRVFHILVATILAVLQGREGEGLQSPVAFFEFRHDGLLGRFKIGNWLTHLYTRFRA